MKILILGHGRHGKDTFAELLQKHCGLSFMSSSRACAEVLRPTLDFLNGEQSAEAHFEERHDNRELWKRLISLYNAADPSALARLILSKSDVYVGMRSAAEYEASEQLFDLIYWVDAGSRVDYDDPTMEIDFDRDRMIMVDNSGSIEDLERKAKRQARVLK